MKVPPLVHFISMGGTIDSYYDGSKDTAVPNRESVIPQYIAGLKLKRETVFTTACLKDSRDIVGSDLRVALNVIEETDATKIIITHGTYTMPDTARFLAENMLKKNVIVF